MTLSGPGRPISTRQDQDQAMWLTSRTAGPDAASETIRENVRLRRL